MPALLRLAPRRAALILMTAACGLLPACADESTSATGAATVAAGSAVPAGASGASLTPDARTVASYRLDTDVVRRWGAATQAMSRLVEARPALAGRMEELEAREGESDRVDGTITLAALSRRYAAVPEFRRAIERAGLDVDEYALVTMTLAQASLAQALLEVDSTAALPEDVSPANLAFVRGHAAEIEALGLAAR